MPEEFNFHGNFPHGPETELIDSIKSNKQHFLCVPTFQAGRIAAEAEDVRHCRLELKQKGCVKLGEWAGRRKNEFAFFTHVGGRQAVLLNTVKLQSNEKNKLPVNLAHHLS